MAGTIGVAVPLSGKFKAWGDAILQGVALAIPEGGPVRVVAKDTRGEPDGAAEAVAQLAAEGAVAIVGGVTNAEALRAATAAQQAGVPLLSLSKVDGIADGRPYVFRLMLTATAQAQALAELAISRRGLRRVVVLYPEIPYGTELRTAFGAEVETRGGSITRAVGYEGDRANFAPMVKELVGRSQVEQRADWREVQRAIAKEITDPYRRAKALEKARKELPPIIEFDAVFVPDFARSVTLLAPTLAVEDVVTATCEPSELKKIAKATGRKDLKAVQLIGGNGWGSDPSLFDVSPGGPGRHVRCAVFVDGFYAGSARPETRRFAEAYERKFGNSPTILEASAYDAARLVRAVVEQGKAATREALRDGLAGVKNFPGATGDLTVGPGRVVEKPLFYLTVDRDGLRELTKAELAAPGAGGDAP